MVIASNLVVTEENVPKSPSQTKVAKRKGKRKTQVKHILSQWGLESNTGKLHCSCWSIILVIVLLCWWPQLQIWGGCWFPRSWGYKCAGAFDFRLVQDSGQASLWLFASLVHKFRSSLYNSESSHIKLEVLCWALLNWFGTTDSTPWLTFDALQMIQEPTCMSVYLLILDFFSRVERTLWLRLECLTFAPTVCY